MTISSAHRAQGVRQPTSEVRAEHLTTSSVWLHRSAAAER